MAFSTTCARIRPTAALPVIGVSTGARLAVDDPLPGAGFIGYLERPVEPYVFLELAARGRSRAARPERRRERCA